jgi:hypothetical protein
MRLDLSQMPKTFQVNALANRDWNLSSEWARWLLPQPNPRLWSPGISTLTAPC